MRNPSSLKQEFLKKWIVGLGRLFRRNMNIYERKKAIKLSADIAMASSKNQTTRWSRAVLANASKENNEENLMKKMPGSSSSPPSQIYGELLNNDAIWPLISHKICRSRKILKRSRCINRINRSNSKKIMAKSIAKRVVQKRTKVLQSLVPGGELMDEVSLIEETLDYITSLRAQVDVMRFLANSSELLDHKWSKL